MAAGAPRTEAQSLAFAAREAHRRHPSVAPAMARPLDELDAALRTAGAPERGR